MTAAKPSAAELAHDFNNLLTAMIGTADAILARPGLDPETRADVEAIREGARRGGSLTRRAAVASTPIPANAAIQQIARLMARRLGAGIPLVLNLPAEDWLIEIDTSRLDRILLNLAANARHAMPHGGTVTLDTRHRAITEAEARTPDTIPPGDYVVISIADTGPGIPVALMGRIFGRGFTTRRGQGGSGLGLPTVHAIVREAKGHLAVDSVEGSGTRFDIYLPHRPSAPRKTRPPNQTSSEGTILLVEDDPLVLGVAARALSRAGWIVTTAESAEHALDLLDRADAPFVLMITDVSLPGLDGLTLTRRARARAPGLPVILTSGYDTPPAGMNAVTFLTKPYDQEALVSAAARAKASAGA